MLRVRKGKNYLKFESKINVYNVLLSFRSYGTATMTLAYIARGSVDAYQLDELFPWDIAAGSLLIREAGGYVCNSNGSEFNFMDAKFICASTEKLAKEILEGNVLADNKQFSICS